jgi:hypothetical protein
MGKAMERNDLACAVAQFNAFLCRSPRRCDHYTQQNSRNSNHCQAATNRAVRATQRLSEQKSGRKYRDSIDGESGRQTSGKRHKR